jgi:hypothetical protein
MQRIKAVSATTLFLVLMVASFAQAGKIIATIYSPDKKLAVTVLVTKDKKLCYTLEQSDGKSKQMLLNESSLGLVAKGGKVYGENVLQCKALPATSVSETYDMLTGKTLHISYTATEQKILAGEADAQFYVVFRVFNDGAAFRYELPGTGTVTIEKELSGFAVQNNARLWVQQYDKPTKWTPSYEDYYEDNIAAGTPSPGIEGWCMPMLVQSNNSWMLIAEADVDENYFSVHLAYDSVKKQYITRSPEQGDGEGWGVNTATFDLPGKTSWKCITAGKSLQTILASTLVFNVCKPRVITDTSWIKPGVSSWSWWSNNESTKEYDSLKNYVDFSAAMHWPYTLVDANWNIMQHGDIEQLAQYAASKNIGLFIWYNSGGANNTVSEQPRDRLSDSAGRRKEFAWLQKIGVKGVKIDFFQSDKQIAMQQYIATLKDAADFHLMVNFHGCTMPKGWSRTYPNLVGMEAVAGGECYLFKTGYETKGPLMNTIYPFTRNVVGGMDYTPIIFTDGKIVHKTTYAHELALGIVFENGILHAADARQMYGSLPTEVQSFLSGIPTTWDEIKYISGFPGKNLVLARRKGNAWYVAGINGEGIAKKLPVDLSSLQVGNRQQWLLIKDNDHAAGNADKLLVQKQTAVPAEIELNPYGGFVMKLITN